MLHLKDKVKVEDRIEEICAVLEDKGVILYGILEKNKKGKMFISYYKESTLEKVVEE